MGNQQNMNDQLRVRREKMQELRAEGIDPFGHRFERDSMNQDLHDKYGEMDKDELFFYIFSSFTFTCYLRYVLYLKLQMSISHYGGK